MPIQSHQPPIIKMLGKENQKSSGIKYIHSKFINRITIKKKKKKMIDDT